MEMGFFVVVGHFHEVDTSSTKFVVEPLFEKEEKVYVIPIVLQNVL
tara:strand:- start:13 stop:150 length:138 start_codon:yes stop_codon:yes gene_type:complete